MTEKTISIRDVARMAGVSTATVSKVLNGKGSISKGTRERVLAIAEREGYVANYAARTLRERATHTIGIVVPDVSNDFYSSLVLEVETLLYDAGYTCYICNSHNDAERESAYLRNLTERQIDGLVFVNGYRHEQVSPIPQGLPVAFIDPPMTLAHELCVSVGNDWGALVHDAVATLASHGCTNVGLLSVFRAPAAGQGEAAPQPFRQALKDCGVRPDRNLELFGTHAKESRIEAAELLGECLDAGYEMDGVVCLGDRVALGACEALRTRGLSIGSDVRVIGMDNSLYSRTAVPAISSIDRHVDEMAKRGVEALLAMLTGDVPLERSIIIPHEVIERESTLGPSR